MVGRAANRMKRIIQERKQKREAAVERRRIEKHRDVQFVPTNWRFLLDW